MHLPWKLEEMEPRFYHQCRCPGSGIWLQFSWAGLEEWTVSWFAGIVALRPWHHKRARRDATRRAMRKVWEITCGLYLFWSKGYCFTCICWQELRAHNLSRHACFGEMSPQVRRLKSSCSLLSSKSQESTLFPGVAPISNDVKAKAVLFLQVKWQLWAWREMSWCHSFPITTSWGFLS